MDKLDTFDLLIAEIIKEEIDSIVVPDMEDVWDNISKSIEKRRKQSFIKRFSSVAIVALILTVILINIETATIEETRQESSLDMIATQLRTNDLEKTGKFLVEEALTRELATKKRVTVTRDEVIEYMKDNRELLYSTQESKNYMMDFLKNLNMTDQECWSNEDTFNAHKLALIHSKFRYLLREQVHSKNPRADHNKIENLVDQEIQILIHQEKNNSTIVRKSE